MPIHLSAAVTQGQWNMGDAASEAGTELSVCAEKEQPVSGFYIAMAGLHHGAFFSSAFLFITL